MVSCKGADTCVSPLVVSGIQEGFDTGVIQNFVVENMRRGSAFDGVGDLVETAEVEADSGFYGDASVVVGANDAGVVFVDGAGIVDGVVDDVVVEAVFLDGAVDILVVDQKAPGGVDEGGVGFHSTEEVVGDNGVVAGEVEGDGVALVPREGENADSQHHPVPGQNRAEARGHVRLRRTL